MLDMTKRDNPIAVDAGPVPFPLDPKRAALLIIDMQKDFLAPGGYVDEMGYDVRPVAISWINRTPEMGASSFSLLKNGLGYARILAGLALRTRFGTRPLPRRRATPAEAPGAEAV